MSLFVLAMGAGEFFILLQNCLETTHGESMYIPTHTHPRQLKPYNFTYYDRMKLDMSYDYKSIYTINFTQYKKARSCWLIAGTVRSPELTVSNKINQR